MTEKQEELEVIKPWAKNRKSDTLHSLCSYLGAFPPALANYFIRYFTDEKDLVFDPFSGRGTTLLESRLTGRNTIASDLNPIAIALSRAKAHKISKSKVVERIEDLRENFDMSLYLPEANAESDAINLIFHPYTLAQLIYLKYELLENNNKIDDFIVGITLGILHGGERKDGSSGYASISMPNTFSMSPEYVRKFVQQKELQRIFRDVFDLLIEKTKRIFDSHISPKLEGKVFVQDVKTLSSNKKMKKYRGKVDLILTSPPYLGIVNYAKQNWIRSWFLNENPNSVSENLDDDLNLNEWVSFSKAFIKELKTFLNENGTAIFVIGDVARSQNSVIPLAREFAKMIKENNLFKNIWVYSETVNDYDKTTRIWGETKGKATTTDRIVILSNTNPFENNNRLNGESVLEYDIIRRSTEMFL